MPSPLAFGQKIMKPFLILALIAFIPGQNIRSEELVKHSVDDISFEVSSAWKTAKTSTPATKLFLYIPNGSGEADSMLKVDDGKPLHPDLMSSVVAIERRFSGTSRSIHDGRAMITSTNSSTVDLPRHIITTIVEKRVYFLFIASNSSEIADGALEMVESTFAIN